MKSLFPLVFLIISLFSCTQHDIEDDFPNRVNLNELNETDFSATLEDSLDSTKNTVYCSTLLFAWDGIRSELKDIHIPEKHQRLVLLHASKSHKNSLRSDEYTSEVKVEGTTITAIVKFAKSLPFETEFEEFKKGLDWNGTKVNAFGAKGDFDDVDHQITILYYENDSNFVIKLHPKNQEHEIILYKTPSRFKTMGDIVQKVKENIALGARERNQKEHFWKYELTHKDEVLIPNIGFNIEDDYPDLVGSKFTNGNQGYYVAKAYQRTAFLLNNEGAKIESEAIISVEATAMEQVNEYSPKLMHFDQPFFVMMKRKEAQNPYFGAWIESRELLAE